MNDLRRDVQKLVGFDAVMRVRTSTGEAPPLENEPKKKKNQAERYVITDFMIPPLLPSSSPSPLL